MEGIEDEVPALIWQLDSSFTGLHFNRAWTEYSGLPVEKLEGTGWLTALRAEDAHTLATALSQADAASIDVKLRRHDGSYRWFLVGIRSGSRSKTGSGARFAVGLDLHERKLQEIAEKDQCNDLAMTLQQVPTMVWSTTPDGFMDYANDRYLRFWGQTLEQTKGWGWKDGVHPDDRQGMVDYWMGLLENGGEGFYEARIGSPERGYRWCHSIATAHRDPDGQILKWYGATFEIEDRKRAETDLKRSEALLAQAQRISQTGSASLNVKTGKYHWSNETFRILEYDPATRPTLELFLDRVHPDDRRHAQHTADRFESGELDIDAEYRLLMPDGRIKHIRALTSLSAVPDEPEYVGVIMDITASKAAEDAIQQAQFDLARISRLATMGELTASIAHEVNQPLASIVTSGEACLRWINRPEPDMFEVRDSIGRMRADALRASDVIRQLRAMFTKDAPKLSYVNINDLINATLPLVRHQLSQSAITVSFDAFTSAPLVRVDSVQIQQVVINLINNAVQAIATAGNTDRTLRINTQIAGSHVQVSVSDTGTGIGSAQLDRLFTAFYTTKSDGMGMGLSICRSIVEAHGGRIWAEDNESVGATVSFTLPVSTDD